MRVFHAADERIPKPEDSLAERSEFELPVPVSKLSSDSHRVLDVEHSPEKCAKVPRARRSRERVVVYLILQNVLR
jgi:hypothetical protein